MAEQVRAAGAITHEIGCDLARLAEVRGAAIQAREPQLVGTVRPLRALVANAGVTSPDTHRASADGYELTFAVNYLAHAQLIGDLLASLVCDDRWAHLPDGTFVVKDTERHVQPFAQDAVREARLWTATTDFLTAAGKPGSDPAVVDDEEQPAGS